LAKTTQASAPKSKLSVHPKKDDAQEANQLFQAILVLGLNNLFFEDNH